MTSSMRVRSPRPIGRRNTTEHFIIFTNTEKTEKYYFKGLSKYCKTIKKTDVCIKVKLEKNPLQLVSQALKQVTPLNRVWIVFDYDQEKHFDEIIQTAEDEGISVAWSNPCIEVWFLAYFENIPLGIGNSQMCIDEFKRVFKKETGLDYQKNYEKIYDYLNKYGDEDEAFKRAKNVRESYEKTTSDDGNKAAEVKAKNVRESDEKMAPSRMCPSTKVDLLVKKILKKEETQSAVDVSS